MTKKSNPPAAASIGSNQGELVSGEELWRRLGYRTAAAFRQAAHRQTVPVTVFDLPNRRGKHAFKADVDAWVEQLVAKTRASAAGRQHEGGSA